jgi:hypothetical protein
VPTVKTLNRQRKTYLQRERALYDALYRGGYVLDGKKAELLPRRAVESDAWWEQRLAQFHYLPRAAQILDELTGMVFQGDLELLPKAPDGGEERPELPEFYKEFLADPLFGNSKVQIVDLLFRGVLKAQIHNDHFFRVLFPDVELPANASRADQEKLGGLRARAEHLDADAVLDFEEDAQGLVWVKTAFRIENRDPLVADEDRKDTLRWEIIDRSSIRVYELVVPHGKDPGNDEEVAEKSNTVHRWAEVKRVPIVRLSLGFDLWLMDRIGSMVIAETRKRNGLHWLEELACYPQPVHTGEESLNDLRADDPNKNAARGATVWLEGNKDDTFEYLEPGGAALEHLSKRLDSMGHDIATVVHQAASAIGPEAAAQVQSAASKVRDSVAKRLLADSYADDTRKVAVMLMQLVSIGRGDDYEWEAIGLEQHDIEDVQDATTEALTVQAVMVKSETFWRRYYKRFVRRALPGETTNVYEQIDEEIEAKPVDLPTPPDDEKKDK